MLYSFIASKGNTRDSLSHLADTLVERHDIIVAGSWNVLVKLHGDSVIDQYVQKEEGHTRLLIGDVANLEELRLLTSLYSAEALTAPPVAVVALMERFLGDQAFALIEGSFNFVTIMADGTLSFVTDALGQQPLHVIFARTTYVTSELKMVGALDPNAFEFEDDDTVATAQSHADDYTPIKNARKAKPGTVTTLRSDGAAFPYLTRRSYLVMGLGADQMVASKAAKGIIHQLLSESVRRAIGDLSTTAAVPLSGGLDSSLVTALAKASGGSIASYAIGTNTSNEFPFSKIVSQHVGTSHTEYTFDDRVILGGVDAAIYLNEIFDGLSAEIQASLMCLYKTLRGRHQRIVTGYGADLLFGGVLKTTSDPRDANADLWRQVYRTRWTGEFSPFGAARYGLHAVHPFWTPRLMSFALSLDPALKVSSENVKIVLREYAEEHDLLPRDIAWRTKIGIHEGSSVNAVFANALKVQQNDYVAKTRYAYSRFKTFITNRSAPDSI